MHDELRESPVRGASFWVRSLAHLIDLTLVSSVMCVFTLPLMMQMVATGTMEVPVWGRWLEIPFDLTLLVGVVVLWKKTQTTPGKKLFGLRIVDSRTGVKPTWRQVIVRYFGYFLGFLPMIPFRVLERALPGLSALMPTASGAPHGWEGWVMGPPLCFGFLWILVDPRRRGWHDLLSGTVTVSAVSVPRNGNNGADRT